MKNKTTKLGLLITGLFLSCSVMAQNYNLKTTEPKSIHEQLSCDSTCLTSQNNLQSNTNTTSTGSQTMPGRIVSCQTPTTEYTTGSCPSGQSGTINYSRSVQLCSDGVTGTYNYGSWTETSRSCYTPPPPPPPVFGPGCPYSNITVPYSSAVVIGSSNPGCTIMCYGSPPTVCQIW